MTSLKTRQIDKYDGQSLFINGDEVYELGNYLGGGASGSVYQAIDLSCLPEERMVAVKILNPVGFKLMPNSQLAKCTIAHKGFPLTSDQCSGRSPFVADNVWWLLVQNTRQFVAAYEDPQRGQLRELPLPKCVEIWGWTPFGDEDISPEVEEKRNNSYAQGNISNHLLPVVAPKYLKWLRSRRHICREMSSMMQLGEHPNIVKLYEVLELVQDSKTTLFLVLELVTGGELFERMKTGHGVSEEFGRKYIRQLLSGIMYCHEKGVCHRDLKPENLLLSDATEGAMLKMADFGLSAVIFAAEDSEEDNNAIDQQGASVQKNNKQVSHRLPDKRYQNMSSVGYVSPTSLNSSSSANNLYNMQHAPSDPKMLDVGSPVKRLRSVVGSPHYVAPEITSSEASGYDGRKVDMWSVGVILYGLLTGALPFGRELNSCERYRRFKKWIYSEYIECMRQGKEPTFPTWLFPPMLPSGARSLIVSLLHPDPTKRPAADDALKHHWCMGYQQRVSEEKKDTTELSEDTSVDVGAASQMLKDRLQLSSNDDLSMERADRKSVV